MRNKILIHKYRYRILPVIYYQQMLLHNLSTNAFTQSKYGQDYFQTNIEEEKKALTSMQPHVDFQGSLGGKVESTHVTDTTLHCVVCLEMCV